MAERCTTLEAEVSGLQDALDSQTAVCAGQREAMGALRQELRDAQNRVESQDERCTQLERELHQGQRDAELERYRAVAAETRKWESREARLVRQLEELEAKQQATRTGAVPEVVRREARGVLEDCEADEHYGGDDPCSASSDSRSGWVSMSAKEPPATCGGEETSLAPQSKTADSTSLSPLDPLSSVLLAQQLPPMPNFTGDALDGEERFDEWMERFKIVSVALGWRE